MNRSLKLFGCLVLVALLSLARVATASAQMDVDEVWFSLRGTVEGKGYEYDYENDTDKVFTQKEAIRPYLYLNFDENYGQVYGYSKESKCWYVMLEIPDFLIIWDTQEKNAFLLYYGDATLYDESEESEEMPIALWGTLKQVKQKITADVRVTVPHVGEGEDPSVDLATLKGISRQQGPTPICGFSEIAAKRSK